MVSLKKKLSVSSVYHTYTLCDEVGACGFKITGEPQWSPEALHSQVKPGRRKNYPL